MSLNIFTVKVGPGSGCLFQPMTDDYLYVLTAKHVIKDLELPIAIERQLINDDNGELINEELTMIGEPFFHLDQRIDAAIIKVKKIDDDRLGQLLRMEDPFVGTGVFKLAGHPASRDELAYSYRDNKLTLEGKQPLNYIEAELAKVANYKEIKGQSGGGIIYTDQGQLYLAGIQKKMALEDKAEMLGRIVFMPISFFDQIIDSYEGLAPLFPYYLSSFEFLRDQAMKIENCFSPQDVAYTRQFLRTLTEQIVNNRLTPMFVKDFFKERLLVGRSPNKDDLLAKELWINWLEYLIILNLLKDFDVTGENLEQHFNCFRILFSNAPKDWSAQFRQITQSNFKGMQEQACIIVGTPVKPEIPVISANHIEDIVRANPLTKQEMQIDDGIQHPLKSYKLIHLYAFQKKCIIEKCTEYRQFFDPSKEQELIDKLRTEYEELLRQ